MPAETPWKDDGHVVVLADVERDAYPIQGNVKFECTGEKCTGPYVSCAECEGAGTSYDEDDDEVDCEDCQGTGMDSGVRQCWIAHGDAYILIESLWGEQDQIPDAGRYRLLYRSEGSGEEFDIEARFGPPVPAPTARANDEGGAL